MMGWSMDVLVYVRLPHDSQNVGKGFSGGDRGSRFLGLDSVVFHCFPFPFSVV
jgi:hypothetical protein